MIDTIFGRKPTKRASGLNQALGGVQFGLGEGFNGAKTDVPRPVIGRAPHGNTVDTRPVDLYRLYDADGNFLKWGVSQDAATRYPANVLPPISERTYPRIRSIALERYLVERYPGLLNSEPWAGVRNPSHPNYDPNYLPYHLWGN